MGKNKSDLTFILYTGKVSGEYINAGIDIDTNTDYCTNVS